MPILNNLTGQKFGRWRVLSYSHTEKSKSFFLCRCDCGTEKLVVGSILVNGKSKSCGCWRRDIHRRIWIPENIDENTLRIPLNKGYFAVIDAEDLHKIEGKAWSLGPNNNYAVSKICRKTVKMHRLIMNFPSEIIDHINGNTLDNRKTNLRLCDHSENLRNVLIRKNNSTGFVGVYYDKRFKKYRSKIRYYNKSINLGSFDSAEDAHQAYIRKAKELHGNFFCKRGPIFENKADMPEYSTKINPPEKNNNFIGFFKKREKIDRNIKGKKFGFLTALSISHTVKRTVFWNCACDCGRNKIVKGRDLIRGRIKSCGCLINKSKKKVWKPIPIDGDTLKIPLSQNKYAIINKDDFCKVEKMSWYFDNCGYARNRDGILMHRVILDCPSDMEV